jgi:hypothetical protein
MLEIELQLPIYKTAFCIDNIFMEIEIHLENYLQFSLREARSMGER